MLPFEDRYSRQRRLPEVGERGQLALDHARPVLPLHAGTQVEKEYLYRSGVVHFSHCRDRIPPRFAHADWFQFTAALHVAQGAASALSRIRAVLETAMRQESDLK